MRNLLKTSRSNEVFVLLLSLVALLTAPASASFKWVQEADLEETGLAIEATINYQDAMYVLGDDWECTEIGPITDIDITGAWALDAPPMGDPNNVEFTLAIHADISAEENPDGYSMPGEILWTGHFGPGQFIVGEGMSETKGWLTPPNQYWYPCCDKIYGYSFDIEEWDAFVQQGTAGDPVVYWLTVQAHPLVEEDKYFGWLASVDHWNDKAVHGFGIHPYNGPWAPLVYPQEHVWAGQAIDLAFAIGGPGMGVRLDFGDAPDPFYPTLMINDGARHRVVENGPILGELIDYESDGIPGIGAWGDDDSNLDDEDGIIEDGRPFWIGQEVQLTIATITGGLLDGFADFNCDGDWDDPEEHFAISEPLYPGENDVMMFIPEYAAVGEESYIRLRISTQGGLSPRGFADDGEVEDYLATWSEEEPLEYDFGDAPDPTYPTLLASDGARHFVGGPGLGYYFESEFEGLPHPTAEGDDNDNYDDEDGVTLPASFEIGVAAEIVVNVTMDCMLDAWIDWNADGDWDDSGEEIADCLYMVAGDNSLFVTPSVDAAPGATTFARFRVSEEFEVEYYGLIWGGEVEDYAVHIEPGEEEWDFGDAPDPSYPTLRNSNGARHLYTLGGPRLGLLPIDTELDGQPSPLADGDDLGNTDDEDGITFSPMIPGEYSSFTALAGMGGRLDAWIDFNADGDWNDAGEQVATNQPIVTGSNVILFFVPEDAENEIHTYARFRISTGGGLPCFGPAIDGEVEDYHVHVEGGSTDVDDAVPGSFGLEQNMPNPFNPTTTISYDIPAGGGHVVMEIFDAQGRKVRTLLDKQTGPGRHSVVWYGRDQKGNSVPSGIYFYRLSTENYEKTRKMMLLQ